MESEVPKESPSPPAPEVVIPVSQPQPQPAKKPRKLNKWHAVTVVLVVIICLQAFLYLSLMTNYNSLESEHKTLLSEHAALEDDHSSLESSYASLQSEYSSLQNSHNSLQASYNALQADYNTMSVNYQALQANFDYYYSDYANLRDLVNQRVQYLDIMDFVTPDDLAVSSRVVSVTGGWSNPSDTNEYWSDVKKMYDWVVANIDYRYDGLYPVLPSTPSGTVQYKDEMWQFPSETLDVMKGDCEDMAILLASMILSYGDEKYAVDCIWITGSQSAHMAVQFPVSGDKMTILDPAGNYYTQDAYGGVGSKDISTEINNWLNYWKPDVGNDVRVYRVFSNDIDRTFSSTSEYTSWMYSRF